MALSVPELKLTTAKTEYGRNKVALAPGKGLMDWVRISANKNLASQRLASVSAPELIKHNQENDCWILIRGNVYDVTKYLEYHPGGIPELMRAAGTDGTKLFDQYHAWVNFSSMLKACLVGPFKGDPLKLPRTKNPVFDNNPALKGNKSINGSNALTLQDFALSISKPKPNALRIKSIVGNLGAENIIVDATSKNLRLVIRRFDTEAICVCWDGFDWSNRNFTLLSNPPKALDIIFDNKSALADVRVLAQQVSTIEGSQNFNWWKITDFFQISMLKACLVGPFKGDPLKLPRTKNPVFDNNPALKGDKSINGSNSLTLQDFALSISKPNPNALRIKSIVGNLGAENIIVDATSKNLRLVIRRFDTEAICVCWDGFDWSNRNFTLLSNPPKALDIIFENKSALADVRVLAQQVFTIEDQVFHPFIVQKVEKMTHDTMLYHLRGPPGLHLPVPMGQHLLFRLPFLDVQRPFTPISYQNCICTGFSGQDLQFFVKIYPSGKLTQNLAKIGEGDIIEVSEPIGRKEYAKCVENADQILLLAAGTGITPMMNIIQHRRKTHQNGQKTTLLLFNKTEDDICEELLGEFMADDFGFRIEHILSEASSNWTGESGRVSSEILAKLNLDWKNVLIFVCGPEGFNNTVMDILTGFNAPSEQINVVKIGNQFSKSNIRFEQIWKMENGSDSELSTTEVAGNKPEAIQTVQ
uniref:Cytochrome-b5 reductase n=2 Tax=Panagrolaimus sp. JU765 TaxID=591449 RepID=A0AC34QRB1_9BILA